MIIGETVNGQEILALKVTKDASELKDGKRPAVLYASAQHAREWITPEMTRRLMHHVLDSYGTDPEITELVNTTELWFLPVLNPDGYDFTFTEGNRLWRKNLRDNNGDGQITVGDGVDLNRNFAEKWGYDNEGSSPDPASDTYRGTGPNSEPETKALDGLFKRVGFEFFVNYHSAAELLLYGIGWQVSTPSPDDVIYQAMAGHDANPAVPGYDPDISAELYTTNGDTDTHAPSEYGTLGFTPEMSTCETASDSVPDDEWLAEDCASGFNFPDDEELIQAEFDKNMPFALSVAQSAHDPDDPVSVVGLDAPDLVADAFDVSYGRDQQVAVTAKRSLQRAQGQLLDQRRPRAVRLGQGVAGRRALRRHPRRLLRRVPRHDPGQARRQGRGLVHRPQPRPGHSRCRTEPFTYTVQDDIGGDVLILAAEDVTGLSPAQGGTSAQYADEYAASLEAAGYTSDVYDFDAQGRKAPHPLGCCRTTRPWSGRPATTSSRARRARSAGRRPRRRSTSSWPSATTSTRAASCSPPASTTSSPRRPTARTSTTRSSRRSARRRTPTRACRCSTTSSSTGWARTSTSATAARTRNGEPFPLVGTEGEFAGFTGDLNAPGRRTTRTTRRLLLTTSSFLPPDAVPAVRQRGAAGLGHPGRPVRPAHGRVVRLQPAGRRRATSGSPAPST